MGFSDLVLRAIVLAFCLSAVSNGTVIFDSGTAALSAGSPTQLGRLSRNGIIADWSSVEPFPGEVNPTTPYHYQTYDIPILFFPFIQISFDDISGAALTFASAY